MCFNSQTMFNVYMFSKSMKIGMGYCWACKITSRKVTGDNDTVITKCEEQVELPGMHTIVW